MELSMREIGRMINNMDLDMNHGLMVPIIKETISKAKNKVKVNTAGSMDKHMMENGLIIISMAMVYINGKMEEDMKANGTIILCMDKEYIHGKMVGNMMEIFRII